MDDEIIIDTLVIGAGVLGLATAYELSKKNHSVFVIERHPSFCVETSSRNSEVVHAGLYYKPESLKLKHCVLGRDLLYDFCEKFKVPVKKCGKYIVAVHDHQENDLYKIKNNALQNNVKLDFMAPSFLKKIPQLKHFKAALWSENSGIVDSHVFAKTLIELMRGTSAQIIYKTQFAELIHKDKNFYTILLKDENHTYQLKCKNIFNAAGLSSAKIANHFCQKKSYQIKPCRGRYFSLVNKYRNYFDRLIYPIPDPAGGLGVHITLDLQGHLKLGPDVDWDFSDSTEADDKCLYEFNQKDLEQKNKFWRAGKELIPSLEYSDIHAGYIGVRPKLFIDNQLYEDFFILKEQNDELSSVHFLGIESPGLTACLAIAKSFVNHI